LAYKQKQYFKKYKNCICALKCPDCGKWYLGQTGSDSELDLKNMFYLINNKTKIKICKTPSHEIHHSMGPIEDVIEVVQVVGKGHFMNALERFIFIMKCI
jgi:hypothetical protein